MYFMRFRMFAAIHAPRIRARLIQLVLAGEYVDHGLSTQLHGDESMYRSEDLGTLVSCLGDLLRGSHFDLVFPFKRRADGDQYQRSPRHCTGYDLESLRTIAGTTS